jgi:hypothetical protein
MEKLIQEKIVKIMISAALPALFAIRPVNAWNRIYAETVFWSLPTMSSVKKTGTAE